MILKNKKGKFSVAIMNTIFLSIILIVVLFQVYAAVIPETQTGGDAMSSASRCAAEGYIWNTSDLDCRLDTIDNATVIGTGVYDVPLSSLLVSGGVVFTIIMAALLVLVIKSSMNSK